MPEIIIIAIIASSVSVDVSPRISIAVRASLTVIM